ncbi:MAG: TrkA family potassium uptake protein [Desulfurococcales archaeon]|nr:TrkA family potassium uptake protein [Desulfurococcales archaeon]
MLIVGAGLVGSMLAQRLSDVGHSVTIIDKDEERVTRIGTQADVEALVKDATNPAIYDEIDLESYDIVVAATDKDEVNLFVAAIARLYGLDKIYVRIRNPQTSRILDILGVKGIVPEPQLVANILFSLIEGLHTAVTLMPVLTGDFVLVSLTVKPTSVVRGRWIKDLERDSVLPKEAKILAVFDGERLVDPLDSPPLEVGHVVIALTRRDKVRDLMNLF